MTSWDIDVKSELREFLLQIKPYHSRLINSAAAGLGNAIESEGSDVGIYLVMVEATKYKSIELVPF